MHLRNQCTWHKNSKVDVIKELIHKINPNIKVRTFIGSVLNQEALSISIGSDLVLGCTDTEHSKAALTEVVKRYLVTGLNVNVSLEPSEEELKGKVIHFTYIPPGQACMYCMGQIDGQRMFFELMSDAEKERRVKEEKNSVANKRGAYWIEKPVIPTVGSLSTFGAELLAGYAIDIICGVARPPHAFMELNLLDVELGLNVAEFDPKIGCKCCASKGTADQAGEYKILI